MVNHPEVLLPYTNNKYQEELESEAETFTKELNFS